MAIYLYDESLLIDRFYANQGLPNTTLVDLDDTTQFMYEFIELIVGAKIPDYELSMSDFQANGVGVLRDPIKAHTEEELNGMFEFYMEYDSEGHLVDELKEERIIKAKAQDKLGYQLFRIYSITKNHENDNLIVKAQHITYDLANNFVEKMEANRLTKKQVMEKIGASTVIPHPFNVTSSNTTTVSSTNLYRTNPLQMIAGMDGSVLQIWGGQIERDNFNLILHDRRGHDDGVTVRYSKNLTGLEATTDISNLVTRIYPFVYIEGFDGEADRLITIDPVDSPYINSYAKVYAKPLDLSFDERINHNDNTSKIKSVMQSISNSYFEDTGNDLPKTDMSVQFAHLWETEEYKDYKVLELVGMGDTVTINHSKLKVDATSIVNYIKYDCIAQVNEEVRLGSVKARLTDNINKIDSIEKKVEQAESNANQAIISANGKTTIYSGPDEPTGAKKGDVWFKIVDNDWEATYIFDGIEWQLKVNKDSAEAKQEAQQAKDRADEAVDRANQATEDANAAIGQAQASFALAQENASTIDSLGLQIGNVEDGLTTISGTVDGLQTTVSDVQGNVANLTVISNAMQARLSDAEGNINTLTQTVDATISRIDNLSGNLITHDPNFWEQGTIYTNGNLGYSSNRVRQKTIQPLDPDTTYTLTIYKNKDLSGLVTFIRLYNVDGSITQNLSNVTDSVTFVTGNDVRGFKIVVGADDDISPTDIGIKIKIQLERGNQSTYWKDHSGDTYTQYSQLSDAINLRVAKGDVINQINIDTSGVLISGKKLILDGDTTVLGTFKLDGSAHIKDASIGTAQIGTIDAAIANIINISANSIVGGILSSQNNTTTFNLNSGNLDFNGQASIRFNQSAGGVRRIQNGRSAILSFPISAGSSSPMAAIGVVAQTGVINVNDESFRGIRIHSDSVSHDNDIIGDNWVFKQRVSAVTPSIVIDLQSSRKSIRPRYTANYNYDIGASDNYFDILYAQGIRVNEGLFTVQNSHESTQGYRVMTGYAGESYLAFYGLNAGPGWTNSRYYALGKSSNRFSQLYLLNAPDVSSDERLKKDITDNNLGLDFINDIDTKIFRMDFDQPENYLKTGVIAQQVLSVLGNHDIDVDDFSMVTKGDDGYLGVQYEQFIAPLIKSVQELDTKLTDNVEFLKLKVQYLEQKIKLLEAS